ncbi:hypothetical protein LJB83_00540 [Clostridia bacterium OttesenSCG-928-F22]|nr:hypothetical protein [Clostridia bacterium OttesenSCG-928-F22]
MKKTIITVLLLVGMVFLFGCQPLENKKLTKAQTEYEALVNGLTDAQVKSVSIIAHPEGYAYCISFYNISDPSKAENELMGISKRELLYATGEFIREHQYPFHSLSFYSLSLAYYDEFDELMCERVTKNLSHLSLPDKFNYTQCH